LEGKHPRFRGKKRTIPIERRRKIIAKKKVKLTKNREWKEGRRPRERYYEGKGSGEMPLVGINAIQKDAKGRGPLEVFFRGSSALRRALESTKRGVLGEETSCVPYRFSSEKNPEEQGEGRDTLTTLSRRTSLQQKKWAARSAVSEGVP